MWYYRYIPYIKEVINNWLIVYRAVAKVKPF